MKYALIVALLVGAVALGEQLPRLTIELQKMENNSVFYFVEDKETGTRCYAFTKDYKEGTAISCVPKGK